jgi:hypothetical protein
LPPRWLFPHPPQCGRSSSSCCSRSGCRARTSPQRPGAGYRRRAAPASGSITQPRHGLTRGTTGWQKPSRIVVTWGGFCRFGR